MPDNVTDLTERIERITRRAEREEGPAQPARAVVTPLNTVTPKAVEYIWPSWLARGKLHILGGHPGDGKSTLTLALAAAGSRGGIAPDGARLEVFNTLLVAAEDDLEDTIRPRLDLHRADVNRIFALRYIVDEKGKDRALSLSAHVEEMRAVIHEHNIDLVVIDPITSYLPKTDRNAEGDIRDALMPLIRLIEDTSVAVIGIMHIGKGGGQGRKPLQQLLGSTAFGAIARVVWMTAELPDDAQPEPGDDGVREIKKLLGVVKSNISMRPPAIEWSRPMDGPVCFYGRSQFDIDQLLSGTQETRVDVAMESIQRQLENGPKSQKVLESQAKDEGISPAALKRGYQALRAQEKVRSFKADYPPYPWLWEWIGKADGDEEEEGQGEQEGQGTQAVQTELLPDRENREDDIYASLPPECQESAQTMAAGLLDAESIRAWAKRLIKNEATMDPLEYQIEYAAWELATERKAA